jgi:hypothetical protein
MQLYWLCYRHNNQISVVIEPAPSLVHARMRASLAGLDEGTFTEGHELDRKTERLSQATAQLSGARRASARPAIGHAGIGDSPFSTNLGLEAP